MTQQSIFLQKYWRPETSRTQQNSKKIRKHRFVWVYTCCIVTCIDSNLHSIPLNNYKHIAMCHRLPCRPRWNEGDDFAHKLSRYASERSRSFLNGPSRWSSHCATHESGNGERAHRQLWVPLTILCFKLDPLQSEMGDVLLLVKERKHWVFALSKRFSNFWKWTPQETVVIYSSILKVLMAEVSCFEKHKKKKKKFDKKVR